MGIGQTVTLMLVLAMSFADVVVIYLSCILVSLPLIIYCYRRLDRYLDKNLPKLFHGEASQASLCGKAVIALLEYRLSLVLFALLILLPLLFAYIARPFVQLPAISN